MFGIGTIIDIAGAVLSGKEAGEQMRESDRRKEEAMRQSNKNTLGRVAGIAALGAVAALGINQMSDKKNSQKRA